MEEKKCTRCGELLPLSMFNKNKSTKDGHLTICKMCMKKIRHDQYEKNKDKFKEKQKQYYYSHREEELLKRKKYQEEHKEQITARRKQYYQKNRDKILERDLKYREKHRDRYMENSRRYYREHHEECLANKKQYYLENKEDIIAKNQIRRARMNAAEGEFSPEQVKECIAFFDNVCAYSGDQFSEEKINCLSMDHIIPITKGGANYIWNIVPTTFSHNSSKGTKDMLSWYQEQEFYSEERLQKIFEWQEYAYQKWGESEIAC